MAHKTFTSLVIITIILSAGSYFAYSKLIASSNTSIICPADGSPFIETPIGSESENYNWICLECGHQWTQSYPYEVYQDWLIASLEPSFVRDYTILYLRTILRMKLPDPLTQDWTGGRETSDKIVGYEKYVYKANDIVVSIGFPVVLPKNTIYDIKVEVEDSIVWEGRLHQRQFSKSGAPEKQEHDSLYDYYGGVEIFNKGIHVIATHGNPLNVKDNYEIWREYWQWLKEEETTRASTEDFISIIISRGDYPTGGYNIQIENFAWLESYPVKFLFQVNFTDPGEDVIVTQAVTNPLVLIPIGKLTPGEYNIEVSIVQYILSFDGEGNPIYTQIMTFAPVIWKQTLTVCETVDPIPSTSFQVVLNGNEAPDLTVEVDLRNGLSEEEAIKIAEAAFIRTMGAKLHRLDTMTYDDERINAHYIWGYDENDMGHIFDLEANLTTFKITIDHCF